VRAGVCRIGKHFSYANQNMPELPDIVVYIESLEARILGQTLERVKILNPFVLRSFAPPLEEAHGKTISSLHRMGKRIVIGLQPDYFFVIHLMIAGRFRWLEPSAKPPGKIGLASFHFSNGTLLLTEAGTQRRASLHLVKGNDSLAAFDMHGLEVLDADLNTFSKRLTKENHTLKRALTDPRSFSGIGNAYSDEILHRAKLSPIAQTQKLSSAEIETLFHATQSTLRDWTERLRAQTRDKFPEKVTAFRPEMAVHGRFGLPCPVCACPVQRIVYATNETNYCARCQTNGVVLADRALSRLLKKSWPRSLEDIE
jgi:formamidopyrimidine-DNA glycosylase